MKDKEFLQWLHSRLMYVHGEDHNTDYMYKLRAIIESMPSETETPNVIKSNPIGICRLCRMPVEEYERYEKRTLFEIGLPAPIYSSHVPTTLVCEACANKLAKARV